MDEKIIRLKGAFPGKLTNSDGEPHIHVSSTDAKNDRRVRLFV
jgi:hypothetical protein